MLYETEISSKIKRIAWELYLKEIKNNPDIHEHASQWWFWKHPEQFKEYYKKAEIELRNEKITKLIKKI